MSMYDFANEYAAKIHKGERFKYVVGPYIFHPRAVASRLREEPEKICALLHDVPESIVKERLKEAPVGCNLHDYEETCVRETLYEIGLLFTAAGYSRIETDNLLRSLDVLTKRKHDPDCTDYESYIARIIQHTRETGSFTAIMVKKADLEDNRRPDRNRPVADQTQKDKDRISRYNKAIAVINVAFPSDIYKQMKLQKTKQKKARGRGPRRPDSRVAARAAWLRQALEEATGP